MVFALVHFYPCAGFHVVQRASAQLAIVCKLFHRIIHIAVNDIGKAVFDQLSHHIDDFLHMCRYFGVDRRPAHIQLVHHFKIAGNIALGNSMPRHLLLIGSPNNFIIHIGEVLHMHHFPALLLQIAANDIPGHKRPGVADMGMIVRSNAANIHFNFSFF